MDSANSGSMQSSSGGGGGDEEYESRGGGESFTSFLNPSSGGGQFGSISDHHHHQQPPSFLSHQYQNTLFNPNNTQNLEGQYGNDIGWSRGLSSQTNHHHNFENLIALSSSTSSSSLLSSNQSLFGTTHMMLNQQQFATSSSSSMTSQSSIEANTISNNNPPRKSDHPSVTKNPKKRTRASRRAPTTVLPTDTTNFRQMVQQFTGIPTAPFSSSSSPYSRRPDLFSGGLSGMRSGNNNNNNLDALNLGNPLYPLRPSAQKFQISPFLAQSTSSSTLSSTMIEALMSSSTNNTMNQSTTNNAQSSTTSQNLLNMQQNQILSFHQSALPTSFKNSSPIFGTNSPNTTTGGVAADVTPRNLGSAGILQHGGVAVSSFDDFGLRHENINSGNYNLSDKGLENVSSSGEGTVGQWISPSDH